jgi:hypothetical protein
MQLSIHIIRSLDRYSPPALIRTGWMSKRPARFSGMSSSKAVGINVIIDVLVLKEITNELEIYIWQGRERKNPSVPLRNKITYRKASRPSAGFFGSGTVLIPG